jgi:16S rRNA (guanine527-N7)-methyltransferase
MHPARIAELLQPFLPPAPDPCHSESGQRPGEEPAVLSASQLHSISTYIDILLHWNTRINLTAIRNPEEIVTRHFGESLFAACHLLPRVSSAYSEPSAVKALELADLGSGAGFPGIPIKLWAPNIALTLIESNHKKATFLREVVRTLTLTDVDVQNCRAEDIPSADIPGAPAFDVVTLRAVERFTDILPIAERLLASSGRLAILIGSSQLETARAALPDLSWQDPLPVPLSQSRVLLLAKREQQ